MNLGHCIWVIISFCLVVVAFDRGNQAQATKIDCHPIDFATKETCESLGCIWEPKDAYTEHHHHNHHHRHHNNSESQELPFNEELSKQILGSDFTPKSQIGEPWCYYPDDYVGYRVVEINDGHVKITRTRPSGLPQDINEIYVHIEEIRDTILRIKIYDANKARFEPDLPIIQTEAFKQDEKKLLFELNEHGHLVVTRRSTGTILFETDLRKLIFSNKFIQINSKLASPFVFGLGEHYDNFVKFANSYKVYSFYNTDKLPLPGGRRTYGGFPFYISFDPDTNQQQNAYGVYLRNSNAMDIILQPDQSITFRPIGGILDFFIFSGPTPNEVVKQYQNLVGLPDLPPRWALGFHLCRYGYGTLERTKFIYQRTLDSKIPFDIQWNDIDNMDKHNDFTYDPIKFKGLPEFVDHLHSSNMYYMILFDPGLSQEDNYHPYQLGKSMDIFVKNATNQTLVGKVWNDSGRTVFPDFSNPKSIDFWTELFVKFQQELKFDGAWIDMNDISNFVDGSQDGCPWDSESEQTPYKPGGYSLQEKTLCLSAKHRAGYEYDLHNLYSFYEAIATFKALQAARPGKRPLIISRSSAPGQGQYGGHWSGDVQSTWDYLRWSIPSLIEHSMYGFAMMGSDICGFSGNSNAELCARWSTLGAFYTFTRNHNDDVSIDQDPVALGPDVVEANRNALTKKYSLIPYLYSLIHRGHLFGEPIIRSLPFEFFNDKETLKVEYQFMWGDGLMISPVVFEGSYEKSTYLPKGRWYETNVKPTHNTKEIKVPRWIDSTGQWYKTEKIALDDIPLFYRGGKILPIYPNVQQTIAETVKQPVGLEVALCPLYLAHGELYLDGGDNVDGKYNHLTMKFSNNNLTIVLDQDEYSQSVSFGQIKIFGIGHQQVNEVRANSKQVPFDRKDHVLAFDLNGMQVVKDEILLVRLV